MTSVIITVKDIKTAKHGNPVTFINLAVAERSLRSEAKSKDSALAMYPQDFELYKVGEFNSDTGAIISHNPDFVANIVDIIEKE